MEFELSRREKSRREKKDHCHSPIDFVNNAERPGGEGGLIVTF